MTAFETAALRVANVVAQELAPAGQRGRPALRSFARGLAARLAAACDGLTERDRLAAVSAVGDAFATLGREEARALFSANGPGPARGAAGRAEGPERTNRAGPADPEGEAGRPGEAGQTEGSGRPERPGAPERAGEPERPVALPPPAGAALNPAARTAYRELLSVCRAYSLEYAARYAPKKRTEHAEHAEGLPPSEARAEAERAAAAFEEEYAQYVAQTQSRVQLFGLTFSQGRQEWPLDLAYISLAVAGAQLLEEPGLQTPMKAELALDAAERVLLRGPAGSGKSTLVQWLALNAARSSFGTQLRDWNRLVPFVLPLRSFNSPTGLPRPADWLDATGVPLTPPAGWVEHLLSVGRALVLVDGVDEVPPWLRSRTESWLRQLLAAYPAARFVVTTRPSAVPEDWLTAQGFSPLALLPMEREDVKAFITHWHASARSRVEAEAGSPAGAEGQGEGSARERALLDRCETALLEAVDTRRDLGRLATNPLMCALLCALNRDRRMYLPRARKELYDAALDMLLIRRDSERDIYRVEGVYLSRDEQTLLLQRLAYWLIRNGQVEASDDEAIAMIAESLDAMPQVRAQGPAQMVFRHLLIRSGLLRELVPGSVHFVHRTFQDYLGAKAAVEARDFGALVRNAHEDTWDNVFRMAVGHARPDERAYLLRELLARADRSEADRSRLVLLAAACLEHAPELDPEVWREVETRTARLLPPRSPSQAEGLAKAGELVLELLPEPAGLTEGEAAATIRTAALVGGDRALQVIAGFRTDDRYEAARELSDAWGRFPVEVYAETVLADAPMRVAHLHVRTEGQLKALDGLPHIRRLHVTWDGPVPEEITRRRDLESLILHRNPRLADLSPLAGHPALRHLGVLDCPQVDGIEVVSDLGTDSLAFGYLRDDLSLAPLAGVPGLRSLVIGFEPRERRIGEVPAAGSLTALHLWQGARRMTLDGIERWPGVTTLTVAGSTQYRQLVRALPVRGLDSLQIRHAAPVSVAALLPYERLARLVLIRCALEGSLESLREFGALRRVVLSECLGTVDLSPLASLDELVIEVRRGTQVTGAERIPPERLVRKD